MASPLVERGRWPRGCGAASQRGEPGVSKHLLLDMSALGGAQGFRPTWQEPCGQGRGTLLQILCWLRFRIQCFSECIHSPTEIEPCALGVTVICLILNKISEKHVSPKISYIGHSAPPHLGSGRCGKSMWRSREVVQSQPVGTMRPGAETLGYPQ